MQQFAICFAHSAQPPHSRNVAAWCFLCDRHLEADCTRSWSSACSATDHAKLQSFVKDLTTAVTTSHHTVYFSVMLTNVFSNASSLTMDTFYNHSYLTVLLFHTVSVKEHTIRHISKTTHLNDNNFLIRMLYKRLVLTLNKLLITTR